MNLVTMSHLRYRENRFEVLIAGAREDVWRVSGGGSRVGMRGEGRGLYHLVKMVGLTIVQKIWVLHFQSVYNCTYFPVKHIKCTFKFRRSFDDLLFLCIHGSRICMHSLITR